MPPMKAMVLVSVIRPARAPAIQPIWVALGSREVTLPLAALEGVDSAPFSRAKATSGYSSAACSTASVYWLPGA